MISVLKKIKDERSIAEFHKAKEDKFSVGFCIDFDDTFFLVECITPKGRWDGYSCYLIDDMDMIQTDSVYLAKLYKMMQLNRCVRREFPADEKTVLDEMFGYIMSRAKVCTVETINETVVYGIIEEIINGIVVIKAMDSYGNNDGTIYIRKDDIAFVSVDSEDERKLEISSE